MVLTPLSGLAFVLHLIPCNKEQEINSRTPVCERTAEGEGAGPRGDTAPPKSACLGGNWLIKMRRYEWYWASPSHVFLFFPMVITKGYWWWNASFRRSKNYREDEFYSSPHFQALPILPRNWNAPPLRLISHKITTAFWSQPIYHSSLPPARNVHVQRMLPSPIP